MLYDYYAVVYNNSATIFLMWFYVVVKQCDKVIGMYFDILEMLTESKIVGENENIIQLK